MIALIPSPNGANNSVSPNGPIERSQKLRGEHLELMSRYG